MAKAKPWKKKPKSKLRRKSVICWAIVSPMRDGSLVPISDESTKCALIFAKHEKNTASKYLLNLKRGRRNKDVFMRRIKLTVGRP